MRHGTLFLAGLVAAALSLTVPTAAGAAPAPASQRDWTQRVEVTAEGGHRIGNPDAPVKLIEYASPTCSHCASFHKEGAQPLLDRYVRSGRVSWELRPHIVFPSDPGIFMLLNCQEPGAFLRLTERLYASQAVWAPRVMNLPPQQIEALNAMPALERFQAISKAIGMDAFFREQGMPQARFDRCLSDVAGLRRVAAAQDRSIAAGVQGTPTFFINGRQLFVGTWQELEPLLVAAGAG